MLPDNERFFVEAANGEVAVALDESEDVATVVELVRPSPAATKSPMFLELDETSWLLDEAVTEVFEAAKVLDTSMGAVKTAAVITRIALGRVEAYAEAQ